MGARDFLTFEAETHTYRFMGAVVPSVTQVLQPFSDYSHIPAHILAAKQDLGTRVHEACHYFDEDDLEEDSVDADVEPYLEAWKRFKADTRCVVVCAEQRVFEPMMQYAGTLDRVLQFDGARWLVDLKTAFTTPAAAGPQTAAYQRALGDTTVTRRAALRLRPDGTYRLDPMTGADDWSAFVACLTLRNFLEKHRDH